MKRKKTTTSGRIAFRIWPAQEATIAEAMRLVPNAWRGRAWFAREALMLWADAIRTDAAFAAEAKTRRKGKRHAKAAAA